MANQVSILHNLPPLVPGEQFIGGKLRRRQDESKENEPIPAEEREGKAEAELVRNRPAT